MGRFLSVVPGPVAIGVLLFFGITFPVQAQPYTLSGYVEDAETGERLVGATIIIVPQQRGVITNAHGFYSLELSAEDVTVRVSFLGYRPDTLALAVDRSRSHTFRLEPQAFELDEVQVEADPVVPTGVDQIRLTPEEIKRLPALLGETDVFKALHLLPGVQGGLEGAAGLYVRGGGPDQNH